MARTILLAILSLLTCSLLVAGEDFGFVYPNATNSSNEDLIFLLGEEINIEWNSPFDAIKLAFIAEDGQLFQFFSQNNTGNDFDWVVNVNNSGSSSPYYYLYFENEDNSTENYYSALFRVDSPADAASTAAATITVTPTPTLQGSQATLAGGQTVVVIIPITVTASTTVTTASSSASDSASTTVTTASSSASDTSTGLGTGAKFGIGIGVPLGVLAFIGAACVIILAARRSFRAEKSYQDEPGIFTGMLNSGSHVYMSPNIPAAGAAPYDQLGPYGQQGVEMARFGPGTKPYGYAPVQGKKI